MNNECGSFVGLLDLKAYVDKYEVDISGVNKRPPFELELIGWKHFVSEGKDAGLHIPITRVSCHVFRLARIQPLFIFDVFQLHFLRVRMVQVFSW